ncbi:MBL fold metallo-hydrolase [Primorskyibacter flagellatus]|uniref:Metallo-beta-lactamase superfamily protein n=1 Tax=Primorskyibacter flagellatus TaxID=1387277 RepID=A0A1W2EHJ0_9RHOB|nr:MBL fold metallo-hydrolase [Primorskyibacter flagellatus]SMD09170.1 Metallo-beta-lactamase superfamily protein [Primorskyibacter flagellatus]
MARLTAISGMGRKSAAIFLLELEGRKLLLDMGNGLELGEHPDLSAVGKVDAVLLSHVHIDHVGGLDRLHEIGNPPVYASAKTLRCLPDHLKPGQYAILPENGNTQVLGLPVETGRAGHAPGGIWMRFDTPDGGFLYTGDFSTEARLLACDPFPRATSVLADASYGDRSEKLADQIAALAVQAAQGAILPCPENGRGPDMVLALSAAGLNVHACARISAETERLTGHAPPVVDAKTARSDQVIVASGPNAETGLPASVVGRVNFRFIFSSHVPRTSPAHAIIESGQATWMGWNVHPRQSDLVALAQQTGAQRILPAFVNLDEAPQLVAALGPKIIRTFHTKV